MIQISERTDRWSTVSTKEISALCITGRNYEGNKHWEKRGWEQQKLMTQKNSVSPETSLYLGSEIEAKGREQQTTKHSVTIVLWRNSELQLGVSPSDLRKGLTC